MVFQKPPHRIQDSIRSGETKIAIIGLGQIGLPQALHFVKEGASVIGVDIDDKKIGSIKQGACPSGMREHIEMFNLFVTSDSFRAKLKPSGKHLQASGCNSEVTSNCYLLAGHRC